MVYQKYGPETSQEERHQRHMQIVYARKIRERQTFMDDLKQYRKQRDRLLFKEIKQEVGPRWYQALSVPQREALDTLEFCIYQDLLEGRPVRTARVMKILGIVPRPTTNDLMTCVYMGRNDNKEMLAHLFLITYGHTIDGKKFSYHLNARLMLSAILYLGLNNLIALLRERFRPECKEKPKIAKVKPKSKKPLASPYLQKMVAALYVPPERKRPRPAPLPNLDDLNEPFEDEPPLPKPPALPPPPPPPPKRLPRSYCDKLAGFTRIEPHSSITAMTMKTITQTSHRKIRGSKLSLTEVKKTYGISMTANKKGCRRRKPVAPSTGMWNAQYTISGVSYIHGRSVYLLSSVSILPPLGYLIHGGYRYLNGEYININCGFCAKPPPPKPDPCDCLKKWNSTIFEYIKKTKCYCQHHYDFGNEETFPPEELPYFQKATRHTPYQFNYQTIFNLSDKQLFVEKEFKRVWDTESMLHVNDDTVVDKKDKKKKKTKRSSTTCLGQDPKPEDYLRCALRLMRRVNLAARLPDIHLVPELREWMRKRIYGPYTQAERLEKLRKSSMYWQLLDSLVTKGLGHVSPPQDPMYSGLTTWSQKQHLNEKFRVFMKRYRLALFRSQAHLANLMWATMFQAAFPDKKFREIYFSYLYARMEDLMLMHPYSTREAVERKYLMLNNRYCCLPDGFEPED
ncbi:uncharacterized protein LOC106129365 [Amyelois transitella]|uniref:uncharacterized protein LOC106129365 n=1 Tax=Amyelois transitella TaxID=680683 RepID=UPI00067DF7A7|nr:uncharacterized protein LOC106129365 [Amyelois transitella]